MPTTTVKTVGSALGRDYSDPGAWETARDADLVSGDLIEIAELYNDSAFVDMNIVLNGWETDATRYIAIGAASTERHTGIINTGVRFLRTIDFGSNAFIYNWEDYVKIDGIEFQPGSGGANPMPCIRQHASTATTNLLEVGHCIFFGNDSAALSADAIYLYDTDSRAAIFNNLFYRFPNTSGVCALDIDGAAAAWVYNNTIFKCYTGIDGNANVKAKNNVVMDCYDTDFDGAYHADSNYNCDSDNSAPGANSLHNKLSIDQFFDLTVDSEDFHIRNTGADIYNSGMTLSADGDYPITNDFDYETRIVPWCIGADEYSLLRVGFAELEARQIYSIYKNGLIYITISCDLRDILSEIGDRITIDVGNPKVTFTKAVIVSVRRILIGQWRIILGAIAGGYLSDEDEVWE